MTIVNRYEEPWTSHSIHKISVAHNFFNQADPYAKFTDEHNWDGFSGFCENPGFWGIPCRRLSLIPDNNAAGE